MVRSWAAGGELLVPVPGVPAPGVPGPGEGASQELSAAVSEEEVGASGAMEAASIQLK